MIISFLSLIFLLGLLSDLKFLKSPYFRMIIQFILIFLFVYLINLDLRDTRVLFVDKVLDNQFTKFIFLAFCIVILINGNNFIDGLNGLSLGYFIVINFVILISFNNDLLDTDFMKIFLGVKVILLFFNYCNKIFLGDNGSYLLGFFFSFYLITIYNQIDFISPFFIILLLWYPSFELLFSIIRKLKFDKSPLYPDNNHLHHLIYFYFFNKNKNQLLSNNLSSLTINLYNFIIIFIGSLKVNNTQYQALLIAISILIYSLSYTKLNNYKRTNI